MKLVILSLLILTGCTSNVRPVPFVNQLGIHPGMPLNHVQDSLRLHGLSTSSGDEIFSIDVRELAGFRFLGIHLYDSSQMLSAYSLVSFSPSFVATTANYDSLYSMLVGQLGAPDRHLRTLYPEDDSARFPSGIITSSLHSVWLFDDEITGNPITVELFVDRSTGTVRLMTQLRGWYGERRLHPRSPFK